MNVVKRRKNDPDPEKETETKRKKVKKGILVLFNLTRGPELAERRPSGNWPAFDQITTRDQKIVRKKHQISLKILQLWLC